MKRLLFQPKIWKNLYRSISPIIFPESCLMCKNELAASEQWVCSFCHGELVYTYFELYTEPTKLDQLFWGRVSFAGTYALLYFEKGKSSQKILHALKYQSNPTVGVAFGKEIGRKIKLLEAFKDLDLLVPVPIHPKKEFVRGYNQSEQIAAGIAAVLSVKMDANFLKKQEHTESQTTRGKFARWDNVVDNFILKKGNQNVKHIALVDDVVTTGATLEALARSIQKNYPDIRISILSLAITK